VSTIQAPGVALHHERIGSGEPIVLVHGTGADTRAWGDFPRVLADHGFEVITYDRRGYGRSNHAPVRNYDRHVDDLAVVLQHLGAPAHVFGWSSGGNTALALATRDTSSMLSLSVLEAPWHGLEGSTPSMLAALARAKFLQAIGRTEPAVDSFFRWASGLADGGSSFDLMTPEEVAVLHDSSACVLAELDPHPKGVMMQHVRSSHLPAELSITWLLGGASGPWSARRAAHARRGAPHIVLEDLPGLSHLAHAEDPAMVAAAVAAAARGSHGADD